MIAGITASARAAGNAALGTATIDFIAQTYTVNGTSYAITDLFEDGPGDTGGFKPGTLIAGRGLPVQWTYDNQCIVKGPLRDLLYTAHSGYVEFEDGDNYFYPGLCYADLTNGILAQFRDDGSSGYRILAFPNGGYGVCPKGDVYNWRGTNRVAWSMGVADTTLSVNGATPSATIDTTGVYSENYMTTNTPHLWIFGVAYNGGTLEGYIRKLVIMQPIAATGLPDISAISTPGEVTDLTAANVTSTSLDLVFTEPAGATGYEVWGRTSGVPDPTDDTWIDIGTDFTITNLDPSTSYVVYVRPYNEHGPGRLHSTPLNVTTTA